MPDLLFLGSECDGTLKTDTVWIQSLRLEGVVFQLSGSVSCRCYSFLLRLGFDGSGFVCLFFGFEVR